MDHQVSDFKGRELTATAVTVAAIGSASLNTWGGFHIFPNPLTGWIIAAVILACEAIAFLVPRHIVKDMDNRHYWKARGASVILVVAIVGCVISGKQAFSVLFLEAKHQHDTLVAKTANLQEIADDYKANIKAGIIEFNPRTDKPITLDAAWARWEAKQQKADDAKLEELKAAPPPEAIVYVLLALFEMVKIGGLYFLATVKSEKGLTKKQRKSLRDRKKLDEKKADQAFKAKLKAIEDADNVLDFDKAA